MIEREGLTLVGIAVANLDDDDAVQLALPFDRASGGALDAALDDVRERFGIGRRHPRRAPRPRPGHHDADAPRLRPGRVGNGYSRPHLLHDPRYRSLLDEAGVGGAEEDVAEDLAGGVAGERFGADVPHATAP